MPERPILFRAPSVHAILAGRKTQTRRIVAGNPRWAYPIRLPRSALLPSDAEPGRLWGDRYAMNAGDVRKCPYGETGDRLWVREAWATRSGLDGHSPSELPTSSPIFYEADATDRSADVGKKRTGLFMAKWMTRLHLDVTDLHVERLHEISDDDCVAEGIDVGDAINAVGKPNAPYGEGASPARRAYACVWDAINGPGSWKANPWVWVVAFELGDK